MFNVFGLCKWVVSVTLNELRKFRQQFEVQALQLESFSREPVLRKEGIRHRKYIKNREVFVQQEPHPTDLYYIGWEPLKGEGFLEFLSPSWF